VPAFSIRTYGDPVLRQRAADVADVDGSLRQLVDGMGDALKGANGLGLAAPQVGVEKRLFVYDLHDDNGLRTVINPTITESGGEFTYEEGCLSVPGLYFTVVRPKDVLLTGWDLDGNEVHIEATELEARLFQHEVDHLNGTLVLEHLAPPQRKVGLRILRERQLDGRTGRGEPITIGLDGEILED
jgi:peptide deformylase